jgi:hypothetical protein
MEALTLDFNMAHKSGTNGTCKRFIMHNEVLPLMQWQEAVETCERLGNGWRLPTIDELNLIFDTRKMGNFGCWSISQKKADESLVWSKGFETGNIYLNPKTNLNRVIPVKTAVVDKTYWFSDLPHPLSPSEDDLAVYAKHKLPGSTLLLGCTRKLIPLSDRQLDIDPWYESETVIVGDWTENRHYYTNIILDGGLCFTGELCHKILRMASSNCKRFITRSFSRRLDIMRVADYFPNVSDFEIQPTQHYKFPDYNFFIWDF